MDQLDISSLIVSLILPLIVTLIAWRHYAKSQYPPTRRYLTFWPRFFAGYADSLLFWPINTIIPVLLTQSLPALIGFTLFFVVSTAWHIYSILLHAAFGQTVGKMVCKVKIVDFKTEGKIGMRQAILRDSVPLLISIPLFLYHSFLVLSGQLNFRDIFDPETLLESGNLRLSLIFWIPMIWFLAEIITMLTNKKRRALHDFVAGTVVIRTRIQED